MTRYLKNLSTKCYDIYVQSINKKFFYLEDSTKGPFSHKLEISESLFFGLIKEDLNFKSN